MAVGTTDCDGDLCERVGSLGARKGADHGPLLQAPATHHSIAHAAVNVHFSSMCVSVAGQGMAFITVGMTFIVQGALIIILWPTRCEALAKAKAHSTQCHEYKICRKITIEFTEVPTASGTASRAHFTRDMQHSSYHLWVPY